MLEIIWQHQKLFGIVGNCHMPETIRHCQKISGFARNYVTTAKNYLATLEAIWHLPENIWHCQKRYYKNNKRINVTLR